MWIDGCNPSLIHLKNARSVDRLRQLGRSAGRF
jgi:hypothetical protein